MAQDIRPPVSFSNLVCRKLRVYLSPSLLPKRRHRNRYIIGLRTDSHPTLTGIRWSCADTPRPLTFSRPKHVPEHPTCCSCAVWGDCLYKVTGSIRHRTDEIHAFRSRLSTSNDIETSGEFGRSQRQNRWGELWFAVNMLLPVRYCPGTAGLTVRHHRIGVIQNRRGSIEPVRRRLATNTNQKTIARAQIYCQPCGVIISCRVIRQDRTISVNERLQSGQVRVAVLLIIYFDPDP